MLRRQALDRELTLSADAKRSRRDHHEISLFSSLPSSIVIGIFSFIAFYPRMVVLRYVCKAWNVLVMRSVDSLRESRLRNAVLFPQLRKLWLHELPEAAAAKLSLLTSLRSLTIFSPIKEEHIPSICSLTGLTNLKLCAGDTSLLRQILLAHTRLCKLGLTDTQYGCVDPEVTLPYLTRMSLVCPAKKATVEGFMPFMLRHSTQLLALQLRGGGSLSFDVLERCAWPALRHLSLKGWFEQISRVHNLLRIAPHLVTVSLPAISDTGPTVVEDWLQVINACKPYLVSLSLLVYANGKSELPQVQVQEALQNCPILSEIRDADEEAVHPVASRLRSLRFVSMEESTVLGHGTALEELEIGDDFPLEIVPMPNLRSLSFVPPPHEDASPPDCTRLREFLDAMPRLKSMEVGDIGTVDSEEDLKELNDFLQHAERRGLEHISFAIDLAKGLPNPGLAGKWLWVTFLHTEGS